MSNARVQLPRTPFLHSNRLQHICLSYESRNVAGALAQRIYPLKRRKAMTSKVALPRLTAKNSPIPPEKDKTSRNRLLKKQPGQQRLTNDIQVEQLHESVQVYVARLGMDVRWMCMHMACEWMWMVWILLLPLDSPAANRDTSALLTMRLMASAATQTASILFSKFLVASWWTNSSRKSNDERSFDVSV